MAKIVAPNKEFTGDGPHGVAFIKGEGHCYTPHAIDWFVRKGYSVTIEEEFDTAEVKAAARGQGPDSRDVQASAPSEDASESALMTEEDRKRRYGIGVGTLLPPGHSITGAPAIDAGLPQLSHGQRENLRKYLDETEQAAADAVAEDLAPSTETPKKSTARKSTRTRKSTARKSTARKSTAAKKSE